MSKRAMAYLVGALLLSGPAAAGAEGQAKAEDAAVLKQRYAETVRRAPVATKMSAADYQRLSQQKRQVDALVARMEAGQPVSAEEIDRVLGLSR